MFNINALIQLKAFARIDGLLLAMIWIAGFAAIVYAPHSIMGPLLTLSTPFFVGWRLIKFRNYALDGIISYRRALAYCAYTFFYASLIFTIAQWAYFQFLDGGIFVKNLRESLALLEPIYKKNGIDVAEAYTAATVLEQMVPIEKALLFMMQNISLGMFASLPIAILGLIWKKKNTN